MKIAANKTRYAITVEINDLPHLYLRLDGFRAMESYVDGFGEQDTKWCIEFFYVGMERILVEYNSKDKWISVLCALKPLLK